MYVGVTVFIFTTTPTVKSLNFQIKLFFLKICWFYVYIFPAVILYLKINFDQKKLNLLRRNNFQVSNLFISLNGLFCKDY